MKKTKDSISTDLDSMEPMDRRFFLEYTLKLTALAAALPLLKEESAQAQTASINAPTRFVNFFVGSGSCQLGCYLSPTANIADLATLTASDWKTPGLATSFGPTSSANAAKENVDYYYDTNVTTNYGSEALGSQPIYHARTKVGSYYMPLIWSSQIPVGTSGTTSMSNLISSNCAMIYGLESSPAHPIATNMLLDPEPGSYTIGGYIAASSTSSFFTALGNNRAPLNFKSPSGAGLRIFQANGANNGPASDVLNAVLPDAVETGNSSRRAWLAALSAKMTTALDSIRVTNMGLNPGISELYRLLTDAKSAVDQDTYRSVVTDFTATLQKYKALMVRATTMASNSIQGMSDSGVNGVTVSRSKLRAYEGNLCTTTPAKAFSSCWASDEIAYIFAFAEVALRNNLTHVLQLGFGPNMVRYRPRWPQADAQGNVISDGNNIDNHSQGVLVNLMAGSLFYYVFNTLLYEFKRNLQGVSGNPATGQVQLPLNSPLLGSEKPAPAPAANDWRDTVILLNTEFPRNPRQDGSGSDHGNDAANVTLFSGRIQGALKIYGKTTYGQNTFGPTYRGAWGFHSSTMKSDRYLDTKDIGASIGKLFVRGTTHPDLQTLIDRSKICFSLDSSGNIVFNPTFLPTYQLVSS
jgi:hypothetical protein